MSFRPVLLVLALAACGAPVKDASTDTDTTTETDGGTDTEVQGDGTECTSGTFWKGGDRESPMMHPGRACFDCHTTRGEGPVGGVAGTVFTAAHEPDDCNGAEGVTVEIIGDDDVVTTLTTNAAGNFITRDFAQIGAIVFPITARVVVGEKVREMVTKQETGDCNSCHTVDGDQAAPGRIQLP